MALDGAAQALENEAGLIRAAQHSDRDAFAQLYEANVARVYRYLRARAVEPPDAEDLAAEVFIKAMKALPSYQHRGTPFVAWLFRIAHNEMVNFVRGRSRHEALEQESARNGASAQAADPAELALTQLRFAEVQQAMPGLTELQREVLSLRFGAGLSVTETAQAMGRKEGAVKFLQHDAIRALRERLGVEEVA